MSFLNTSLDPLIPIFRIVLWLLSTTVLVLYLTFPIIFPILEQRSFLLEPNNLNALVGLVLLYGVIFPESRSTLLNLKINDSLLLFAKTVIYLSLLFSTVIFLYYFNGLDSLLKTGMLPLIRLLLAVWIFLERILHVLSGDVSKRRSVLIFYFLFLVSWVANQTDVLSTQLRDFISLLPLISLYFLEGKTLLFSR